MESWNDVIRHCIKSASNTDIEELLSHKEAGTYSGKCIRACIFEKGGVVCTIFSEDISNTTIFFILYMILLKTISPFLK